MPEWVKPPGVGSNYAKQQRICRNNYPIIQSCFTLEKQVSQGIFTWQSTFTKYIEVHQAPLVVQWLESICNARDMGSSLVREDFSGCGSAGPCTTTTEPVLPRARALQWERPPQGDACKLQLEAHSPQLEKVCAQQRSTSYSQIHAMHTQWNIIHL